MRQIQILKGPKKKHVSKESSGSEKSKLLCPTVQVWLKIDARRQESKYFHWFA